MGGAIVMPSNVARPLRSKFYTQKIRGELCPRRRDATCLREGSSPKGASQTSQTSQVVTLTELKDPYGKFATCECIKVTESDLRRYVGNLDILRLCAAEHAANPRIPFPSPGGKASPCGAAGGRIVGTSNMAPRLSSLKEERSKSSGATTNLPRVERRYADFDGLFRVSEQEPFGTKGSGSTDSTAAPSTNNSRASSRQAARKHASAAPSTNTAAPSTNNSRASSQCTSRAVSQRGRRRNVIDADSFWPSDEILSFVS